jgi:hypothetical protein
MERTRIKTRRDVLRDSAALAVSCALPAALIGSARAQPQDEITRQLDVPYVPTPVTVVDAMLDLAKVTKSDIVYDLGCGDGRIVVRAATRFGCRGVGVVEAPFAALQSVGDIRRSDGALFVRGFIENTDVFTLTVIVHWMRPAVAERGCDAICT